MAIPWLIGAAVAVTAAYIASSDDDDDRDNRAYERAREQEREIEREAERRRQEAQKAEQTRLVKLKQEQLRTYAESQLELLLRKHNLNTSLNSQALVNAAIRNQESCTSMLAAAFDYSATVRSLDDEVQACREEIAQLEKLYLQLGV